MLSAQKTGVLLSAQKTGVLRAVQGWLMVNIHAKALDDEKPVIEALAWAIECELCFRNPRRKPRLPGEKR